MRMLKTYQKKITGIFLAVSLTILSVFQVPLVPVKADTETDIVSYQVTYGQTEARNMLTGLNAWRTSDVWYWDSTNTKKIPVTGRAELSYDAGLEQIAMQRAAEIALSFSHTRPNGENTWTAYENRANYGAVGENIAAGQNTAAYALECWKEEEDDYAGQGHRRNMLNEKFNYIGIGHVFANGCHYWVQEFSQKPSGKSLTDANDNKTKVSAAVGSSRIKNCGLKLSKTSAKLSLSGNDSCACPDAEAFILLSEAWPSKAMSLIEPEPVWVVSGSAVTLDGTTVRAVSVGTAVITASVTIAGMEKTADFTVTVTGAEEPAATAAPTSTPTAIPVATASAVPTSAATATPVPTASAVPTGEATAAPTPTVSPSAKPAVKKPGKVSIRSAKNKKRKTVSISWKKISGATGYQVQCSLDKSFYTKVKNKTVLKTSASFQGLKKKTYYVKVRAYRQIGLEIIFGKWSSVKKVKVKK